MFISFARPKETNQTCLPAGREKDGLGFQRPTNGSIPKPDKPFVPAFQ
jgi:hypothetical protein